MFISQKDFELMVKTIDEQNNALKKAVRIIEDSIHIHHGMQKQIDRLMEENRRLASNNSNNFSFPNTEERRSNG